MSAATSFFLTTAIDYTNAPPHIGHAYEKILADVLARHARQRGQSVFFLTGVDQHGQKVQQAAQREGRTPAEFAEAITSRFRELWSQLAISYDGWAATTHPTHHRVVGLILERLRQQGDLYTATHKGFYSVRQEQFLTDKDRQPDGTFGPEWGEVIELEEENWYFRLSRYLPWLRDFLARHSARIFPPHRAQELINAAALSSGDLCISRPRSRLAWGIPLPFAPEFVTYVWFDALINYISFAGYLSDDPAQAAAFAARWPALHIIGKDILVPAHGIYWLCMLKAMGFPDEKMPRFLVHGYVNLAGAKMSKTLGNVLNPAHLAAAYGPDALRFYLMADCVCGQDMEFREDLLVRRHNSSLANSLGNLLNRTLNMTHRYLAGTLSLPAEGWPAASDLAAQARATWPRVAQAMDALAPQAAIEHILALLDAANRFAESEAPWKLAKDPAQTRRLGAVLTAMADAVRHAASLLTPFIPTKAAELLAQLNLPALDYATCAAPFPLPHTVAAPRPVFPRLEEPKTSPEA